MIDVSQPYKKRPLRSVALKIKDFWPKDNPSMLWFHVLERAILDLGVRAGKTLDSAGCKKLSESEAYELRKDAADFLSGQMFACEVCGVDSDYIHRFLEELNKTKVIFKKVGQ